MRSVPSIYNLEQPQFRDSRVGDWYEMAASLGVSEWSTVSWLVSCEISDSHTRT
jgi:hypothetical protein